MTPEQREMLREKYAWQEALRMRQVFYLLEKAARKILEDDNEPS